MIDPEILADPQAFVGQMIEVRDNESDGWTKRVFACMFEGEVHCKRLGGPNLRPWLHARPIVLKRVEPTLQQSLSEIPQPCWCRESEREKWLEGWLMRRVDDGYGCVRFLVKTNLRIMFCKYCEIEAPND